MAPKQTGSKYSAPQKKRNRVEPSKYIRSQVEKSGAKWNKPKPSRTVCEEFKTFLTSYILTYYTQHHVALIIIFLVWYAVLNEIIGRNVGTVILLISR